MLCTWGPTSGVRFFLSSGRQEMFVRRIPNKGRGGHFWGVSFERVLTEENVPWTFMARLTSSLIDALSAFLLILDSVRPLCPPQEVFAICFFNGLYDYWAFWVL